MLIPFPGILVICPCLVAIGPLCPHRVCHLGEGSLDGLYSRRPIIRQPPGILVSTTPWAGYIPILERSLVGMLLSGYPRCFWRPPVRFPVPAERCVRSKSVEKGQKSQKSDHHQKILCRQPAGQLKWPSKIVSKNVKNRKNKSDKCQKSQKSPEKCQKSQNSWKMSKIAKISKSDKKPQKEWKMSKIAKMEGKNVKIRINQKNVKNRKNMTNVKKSQKMTNDVYNTQTLC